MKDSSTRGYDSKVPTASTVWLLEDRIFRTEEINASSPCICWDVTNEVHNYLGMATTSHTEGYSYHWNTAQSLPDFNHDQVVEQL